jgi:hypothetical protein
MQVVSSLGTQSKATIEKTRKKIPTQRHSHPHIGSYRTSSVSGLVRKAKPSKRERKIVSILLLLPSHNQSAVKFVVRRDQLLRLLLFLYRGRPRVPSLYSLGRLLVVLRQGRWCRRRSCEARILEAGTGPLRTGRGRRREYCIGECALAAETSHARRHG